MSRGLLILIGAAVFCDSPRTFAAVQSNTVWQLGLDDGSRSLFGGENYRSNDPEEASTSKDDDYFLAGDYPSPIGLLVEDEELNHFERAITQSDPRNRIHFPLDQATASSESLLTLTVDLIQGGAWTGVSQPGFGRHDIMIRFNGQIIETRDALSFDTTIRISMPATSFGAITGNNVLEIERTGGSEGGYIQFDYLKLEADTDGLADGDNDNIPRWYEETYGLDDGDPSDADLNSDGDSLDNLAEFLAGTNPTDPDTDNDGIEDGAETISDPLKYDTDGDGLSDGDEATSDPRLIDTDSDTFPDNIEREQGTDPNSASSTPFPFAGVIGLQFVSERKEDSPLQPHDPAGLFRFPHWNASDGQPRWHVSNDALTGSLSGLKNCRGQATTVSADWSFRYATSGNHKGNSNERLLNGMICGDNYTGGKVPVTLNLSGIPYSNYDLIAYIGDQNPDARSSVELIGSPSSKRYYLSDSSPPFQEWKEVTATNISDISKGNYVRYRNLTGDKQSILVDQIDNDRVALHGIQIIDMSTDADSDNIPDAIEIEHGMNPALNDAAADLDDDGLNNAAELVLGTDPADPDTDRDGLRDGEEAAHHANPLNPDTDGDSIADGDEINGSPFPSLANLANSDGDSFTDDAEVRAGSDPMDSSSVPPPVPSYSALEKTWTWRIDDLRIRWNHSQAMLGALTNNDTMLVDMAVELDDGGWSSRLSMGLFYREGSINHLFRCNNEVFHREDRPTSSLYSRGSTDIRQALGFSGVGDADVSYPLRFEFVASRPTTFGNSWSITFTIADMRDPLNPVVIATSNWENCPSVGTDLMNGRTQWTDTSGNPDQISYDLKPGVHAFISRQEIGALDTDRDGMPDAWESLYLFDINNPADAALNADSDSLTNLQEFLAGSNPRLADTDGDGANDDVEFAHGTSPSKSSSYPQWINFSGLPDDLNGDGMSDAWTIWAGGKARAPFADDDGDGMSNQQESEAGTDPDDPDSVLKLELTPSGNHLVLQWTDLPFKAHWAEKSDLRSGWSPLENATPPSITRGRRKVTILDELSNTTGSNFFRTNVGAIDTDGDGVEDWVEENVLDSSSQHANSLGQPLV
ncbi:MAG: hypothetical protein WBG04_11155, partial [Haloferula sp.]